MTTGVCPNCEGRQTELDGEPCDLCRGIGHIFVSSEQTLDSIDPAQLERVFHEARASAEGGGDTNPLRAALMNVAYFLLRKVEKTKPAIELTDSMEYVKEIHRLLKQRYEDMGDSITCKAAWLIEDHLLRERCPDCGRNKARNMQDFTAGDCPKWWAIRDPEADIDCQLNGRKLGYIEYQDGLIGVYKTNEDGTRNIKVLGIKESFEFKEMIKKATA